MEVDQTTLENPSIELYSIYVSGYLREFQGFSAEIGTRVNQHSEFGQAWTFSINPSYRINRKLKLFSNYSTGFKAPTLNELFGPFGANPDLLPQYSRHAEAGVQYTPQKKRNTYRATLFTRQIKNAIVYGNLGYINLDRQTDHGLELEVASHLSEKISVQGYYSYTIGAVHTRTFDNRDTSFNNLIRRPKNTIGGSLSILVSPQWSTTVSIKSVGKRKDIFFDPGTFSSIPVKLPSYQLLNFYIEYKCLDGKIKGYIDAKNLLNRVYSEVYGYNALRFNINAGMNFLIVK
jgi:vitamin B12 transporter